MSLELLKEHISKSIPVYLSLDKRFLIFHSNGSQVDVNEKVKIVDRRRKEIELSIGQIWYYLKHFNNKVYHNLKEFPTVGIRDRVVVKRHFFDTKKVTLSEKIFEKPKDGNKRVRMGDDLSLDAPSLKKRKYADEEMKENIDAPPKMTPGITSSRDEFFDFMDAFQKNEFDIKDKDFVTFNPKKKDISKLPQYSYDDEKYEAYIKSTSKFIGHYVNGNTVDVMSMGLLMKGGSYDCVGDFSFVSERFGKIRAEEKYFEKQRKKGKIKKKKEKVKKEKKVGGSDWDNLDDFEVDIRRRKKEEERKKREEHARKKREEQKRKMKLKRERENEKRLKNMDPIIIVPAQVSSVLTIYNSQSFFEKSIFISSSKCSKIRTKYIRIKHVNKNTNKTKVFRVYDNIKHLTSTHWKCVVAVFTNGKEYEFKKYPEKFFKSRDPVAIFRKIKGFHLCYRNQSLNKNLVNWRINVLRIDKDLRHDDMAACTKFWKIVDPLV